MEKYKLVKNAEEYWEFIRKLRNLDFYKAFSIIKLECMNKTKKKILNTQLISKIALLILY